MGAAIMGAAMLRKMYDTVSHLVNATGDRKCLYGGVRHSLVLSNNIKVVI